MAGLGSHSNSKEETVGPRLIPVMRPDRTHPLHGLVPKDTLGDIFFLTEDGVHDSGDEALLLTKEELGVRPRRSDGGLETACSAGGSGV